MTGKTSILIARRIVDGQEVVCLAPWYYKIMCEAIASINDDITYEDEDAK